MAEVLIEQLPQRVPAALVATHVELSDHLGRLDFDDLWEAVGPRSSRRRMHGPGDLPVFASGGVAATCRNRDLPDAGRSLPYPWHVAKGTRSKQQFGIEFGIA